MRKIILSLSTALLASTPAWAINCQVETNCTTLGYTSSKDEGNCLKCPFGNQWACLKTDTSCPEDSSGSNCNVGDILYSDMTCNANVIASKTPIGVVFDKERRLATALIHGTRKWSLDFFDVPGITNKTTQQAAIADMEGKTNTEKIVAYCNSNGYDCPAFNFVSNHVTEGTHKGDWYLPSLGELKLMYSELGAINLAFNALGALPIPARDTWSSTAYSKDRAWTADFEIGYLEETKWKNLHLENLVYAIPILAF